MFRLGLPAVGMRNQACPGSCSCHLRACKLYTRCNLYFEICHNQQVVQLVSMHYYALQEVS